MTGAGSGITRQLQTLFNLGTAGALSDGELLERFATRRDAAAEAAFASASVWTLTEGVIRTMIFTRWKMTAMVLLTVGFATAGAGGLAYQEPDAPGSTATTQGEASKAVPPDRLADPDAQIENLKAYLRELRAKVEEKQKEWLEMAAGLNDEPIEPAPGPPGGPTVPREKPRRTMVEEYKSVRELAFKANMDLIEAEALLNVRKAENPAPDAEVDRELAIQKRIEVALRHDPEIAAVQAQVEAARRVAEQASRRARPSSDPSRVNALRKVSALSEKLKVLADEKREAIAKRLRDRGVDGRNTSFPDLKERRDLYEKLLGTIEKINRQRGIESVKMDLLREELSSLKGMQDSISKRIEQMQFEANRR